MDIWPRRLTVGRIMVAVALLALVLGAGLFIQQNGDADRALVARHLRELSDESARLRMNAADDLGRAAPSNLGPVMQGLAGALLGDPDSDVRRSSARSMGMILVRAGRPARTGALVDDLGTSPVEADAFRVLIRAIDDPDAEVARSAVEALGNVVDSGVPLAEGIDHSAVAPLWRRLDGPDAAGRGSAIWTLARLAHPPAEGRDRALTMIRRDPDAGVRTQAIRALVRAWPAADLYPVLLDREQGATTDEERSAAAWGLGALPPPTPAIASTLMDLAERGYPGQSGPLKQIAALGPAARPLLGRLRVLADRWLVEFGDSAWYYPVDLIARIDPYSAEAQAMLPHVDELIWRPDGANDAELYGSNLLHRFGPAAGALVPAWQARLASSDPAERHRAASLLGTIGAPAVGALADLEALARTDADPVIRRAVDRLRRLAPADPSEAKP